MVFDFELLGLDFQNKEIKINRNSKKKTGKGNKATIEKIRLITAHDKIMKTMKQGDSK